ncbi:zinc ribbon domain-containing protein [Actinosynnema sp. NPDC049800]
MTCPNCGTPVLSGVSSCRSCGASLERKAVPSYLEPAVAQVPPVIQAPYAPPMGHAPAEPRRWEDVSSLRTPLLVLLVADAVLALSTMVVPLVGLP